MNVIIGKLCPSKAHNGVVCIFRLSFRLLNFKKPIIKGHFSVRYGRRKVDGVEDKVKSCFHKRVKKYGKC